MISLRDQLNVENGDRYLSAVWRYHQESGSLIIILHKIVSKTEKCLFVITTKLYMIEV